MAAPVVAAAMTWMDYDVVVVGGGAAGLSAALVLGRARRRVAVVDAGSPRNAPAAHMQGFLSRDGMPPLDLLAIGRAEVASYGVESIEDRVVEIDTGFVVRLAGGRVLHARRILVATDVRDELPEIPGVRERWGRDLLHCPYCHGWEVRDQPIGVLGTRPDAVQHALLVRQWSDDVAFFVHTLDLTSDTEIIDARGDQRLAGVTLRDATTGVTGERPVTAVFILIGAIPRTDWLPPQIRRDDHGFVLTGGGASPSQSRPQGSPVETSIAGVFAVGDARAGSTKRVASAVGEGSVAVRYVHDYLARLAEDTTQ
jgi:thioredoxin reductase